MFKRPSSRSRTKHQQIELNLVPILDAMVTLVAFLLFTMSFMAIVSIESPFPQMSTSDVERKLKERPLQLTLTMRPQEVQIWSPFERVPTRHIPNTEEGQPDTRAIHEALVGIKQQFPRETKVVLVPNTASTYDTLIAVMDSVRMLDPTDPPLFLRNESTGNDEPVKALFPEVIFGNLLGDS